MHGIPAQDPMLNAPPNRVHGIWTLKGTAGSATAPSAAPFVVPDGVYTIWATICAGGGGTNAGSVGPTGGTTSLSSGSTLLSATGGSGFDNGGAAVGATGGTPNGFPSGGSVAGGSPFGLGVYSSSVQPAVGWGSANGFGGGGGWYIQEPIAVVPGQVILVTVGGGGVGNANSGVAGLATIEW